MLSASYGVAESRFLLTYTYLTAGVAGLGVVSLDRNTANDQFEVEDREVWISPTVSTRSWATAADTPDGWVIAFGTEASGVPIRALWSTVRLTGGSLSIEPPVEVSSTTSGQTLHPSAVSTPQGIFIAFRYDSRVNGVDRYQVRGRWVTGTNFSPNDVVLASYGDSISRVRVAYSGSSLGLVWNVAHDYQSGNERVVLITVPLAGSIDEPARVSPEEILQQRPAVIWSTTLNRFVIVWVQEEPDGEWAAWLSAYTAQSESVSPSATAAPVPATSVEAVPTAPQVSPPPTTRVHRGTYVVRGFENRSTKMSMEFKRSIRAIVREHPTAIAFECTGFTAGDQVRSYHPSLARARAKSVCDYITQITRGATTSISGRTSVGLLGAEHRKVTIRVFTRS